MAITVHQIKEVMKYHLRTIAGAGQIVTDETKPGTIVNNDNPGGGVPSSQKLFRDTMNWTFIANGGQAPTWPRGWLEMEVSALAEDLEPKVNS